MRAAISRNHPSSTTPKVTTPDSTSRPPPFLGVERSFTGRLWRSRVIDDGAVMALSRTLQVPDVVARVLAGRGVTAEDGESYLNPTLKDLLPDPARFRDMDVACGRLVEAIKGGEAIAIFGDYDVDGATSTALLVRFLRAVGGDVRIYIPDRIAEGYGPNAPALRKLAQEGVKVVVTVDCGTTAHEPLREARAAKLDVVVVDHHAPEADLPDAFAVINPNRLDETGEYGQLAAVGVAFLLVVAVNRALREAGWYSDSAAGRREPDLRQWLDLVALGTICDVVPLLGVNRALVAQGLKVMAARGNPGIAALADVARVRQRPGTYHAGFILGPRVNAGGRVGRADLGALLLSEDDPVTAERLAEELDRHNSERKTIEAMVNEEAKAKAESMVGVMTEADGGAAPVLVVASEGWHPGVIGIVAQPSHGTVSPSVLRHRAGGRHRQGFGTFGQRRRPRRGGHRGASGRPPDQRRGGTPWRRASRSKAKSSRRSPNFCPSMSLRREGTARKYRRSASTAL